MGAIETSPALSVTSSHERRNTDNPGYHSAAPALLEEMNARDYTQYRHMR